MPLERWLASSALQRGEPPADLALEPTAAWWVLETAALRRAELRAVAQLKYGKGRPAGLQAQLDGWRNFLGLFDAPATLLPAGGYGIVQPDELHALQQSLAQHRKDGQAQWQGLRAAAEQALPAGQRRELEQTRQRVQWLAERMRRRAVRPHFQRVALVAIGEQQAAAAAAAGVAVGGAGDVVRGGQGDRGAPGGQDRQRHHHRRRRRRC